MGVASYIRTYLRGFSFVYFKRWLDEVKGIVAQAKVCLRRPLEQTSAHAHVHTLTAHFRIQHCANNLQPHRVGSAKHWCLSKYTPSLVAPF